MQVDSDSLSTLALAGSGLVTVILAGLAIRRISWRTFLRDPSAIHRWAISAVGLMVLWSIRTEVPVAPGLHVLGVTTVTLFLGVSPAAIVTLLAQAVTGVLGGDPAGVPCNWLISAAVPIAVTEGWRRLILRLLPPDPFAFIFGSGFFGAALAAASACLAATLLAPADIFSQGAVPAWGAFLLLMGFPEAFINGAVVTLLVVYFPDQLAGYHPAYRRRRPL